jgi:hypothetical protein
MTGRQGTLYQEYSIEFKNIPYFFISFLDLLCCPALSPQIVGTEEVDPPTVNVSVQVPAVGWVVVNETKSKLKEIKIIAIRNTKRLV